MGWVHRVVCSWQAQSIWLRVLCIVFITGLETCMGMQVWVRRVWVQVPGEAPASNPYLHDRFMWVLQIYLQYYSKSTCIHVMIPASPPTFSLTSHPATSPEVPCDTSHSHVPLRSHVIHPRAPSCTVPRDPVSHPHW